MAEKKPGLDLPRGSTPNSTAAFREHINLWKHERALGETDLEFPVWLKATAPSEYPKWLILTNQGR